MRCYAFVLASMYRYAWLITFEIFRNFFFWIEGWVGVVYRIQTFLDFYIFFIFTRLLSPNMGCLEYANLELRMTNKLTNKVKSQSRDLRLHCRS